MEIRSMIFGCCLGFLFFVTLIVYREISYLLPSLVKKYHARKNKMFKRLKVVVPAIHLQRLLVFRR